MTGPEIGISQLHGMVLREAESDAIQELAPDLYRSVSEFLGKMRREEYDGVEEAIKDAVSAMVSGLVGSLLSLRLAKATKSADYSGLLDEEKFVMDAVLEMDDRREMILGGILAGKSRHLESVAHAHKVRPVTVRFLRGMDQFVGADMEKYGPYTEEDVASIPYENAQALIKKEIVSKIRWDD